MVDFGVETAGEHFCARFNSCRIPCWFPVLNLLMMQVGTTTGFPYMEKVNALHKVNKSLALQPEYETQTPIPVIRGTHFQIDCTMLHPDFNLETQALTPESATNQGLGYRATVQFIAWL